MTTESSRYGRGSDEWALLASATALVHYLDANDAGPGFYALAQEYGLLPSRASKAAKEAFWVRQVGAVHEIYARNA